MQLSHFQVQRTLSSTCGHWKGKWLRLSFSIVTCKLSLSLSLSLPFFLPPLCQPHMQQTFFPFIGEATENFKNEKFDNEISFFERIRQKKSKCNKSSDFK